ncbi:unnamed protein product, partial [Owenia fusiformis]
MPPKRKATSRHSSGGQKRQRQDATKSSDEIVQIVVGKLMPTISALIEKQTVLNNTNTSSNTIHQEPSSDANNAESKRFLPLSSGIPLDSGISQKLKIKIVSDEYIDIAHLLEKIPGEIDITVTIKKQTSSVVANP